MHDAGPEQDFARADKKAGERDAAKAAAKAAEAANKKQTPEELLADLKAGIAKLSGK